MKTIIVTLFFLIFSPISEKKIINNELNHFNLYEKLIDYGVKYPDIVFAQAVIESGNFKSKLCTNNKNLFGMKMPGRRETTAIGKSKGGYAKYDTWGDSVFDYLLYQNYVMRNKNMNRKEYLSYLGRTYAEDKQYLIKINKTMIKYKNMFG